MSVCIAKKPPPLRINGKYNYRYKKDSTFQHYTYGNLYYCSLLSKLIIKADLKKPENKLFERAISRLNVLFENILVDEFQDFRKDDYELLINVMKNCDNIQAVGDFYQHSVSGQNKSGKPFKVGNRDITYNEYTDMLRKAHIRVDTTLLSKTRRCPQAICNFVKEKLRISIDADNDNNGSIRFIESTEQITDVLENSKIVKLVYKESKKYMFNCINWGYSKGDTYSTACVILTEPFSDIDKDSFVLPHDSDITRNMLYVAMTRTKGDVYFIKKSDFDKVGKKYIKTGFISETDDN
jgi:DNA helicase II / ATP-dependent DNA helicase PcrA